MKGNPLQSIRAMAPQISLALLGLMVSVPFLNFYHSYPLPTFYTEWTAFALGTAALFGLAFTRHREDTRIPYLSIGLIALMLVLLIQIVLGMAAYVERSFLGILYVLWAALLVWLGAYLREQCGLERVGLVLQVSIALGGFLVAITGFVMYYQVGLGGFRLISGPGMDGMYGTVGQRNNFANYLGCALASVVFLRGRLWLSLPVAILLAAPIILALVLSTSRSAWLFVLLVPVVSLWVFWSGDRRRLKSLLVFSLFVLALFVVFNVAAVYTAWFAGPSAQTSSLGERWMQTLTPGGEQTAVYLRLYLAKEAWRMFAGHPFLGVGFGEFAGNLFEYAASFDGRSPAMDRHSHDIFLQLLAETGLIGALSVVLPLLLWLRSFPWSKPDLNYGWLLVILVIEMAHSLVEFPLWHANFLGLSAVLVGVSAQPAVGLHYSRLRQAALATVFAAGLAAIGKVFVDYRSFESWYRDVDISQQRKLPLTSGQVKSLGDLRATSFFAGYYELLASEIFALNRENLDAKLELNTRVLRFIPVPTAVFRQAVLLSLKGEHEEAARVLSRLATIYPQTMPENLRRIDQMAQEDPKAFGQLAAEMRRGYRP